MVGELSLTALTMADPSTGWFEIVEVPDKTSRTVAELFDRTWLCRYPRPVGCTHDHGSEFFGSEFSELLTSYGIESKPTTVHNPQANFVERVHQTLENMLRTCELERYEFPEQDPWAAILAKCCWAIRSTVHLVLDATPTQLVFGRDMLFDLSARVSVDDLRNKKRAAALQNNQRENSKRVRYRYKEGEAVLLDKIGVKRKLDAPRAGPYNIERVYANGTVKIRKGIVSQKVNIRRISPYRS